MNRRKRPIQRERDVVEQELLLERLRGVVERQEQGEVIDIWSVRQFGVFTQLVCQSLIMKLFEDKEIFTEMEGVTESTRRGLNGLNLEVMWGTTGCIPHLSTPRKAARGNSTYERSFGLNWVRFPTLQSGMGNECEVPTKDQGLSWIDPASYWKGCCRPVVGQYWVIGITIFADDSGI
jgi:hypothetical protein